jgi:hypothetical protein
VGAVSVIDVDPDLAEGLSPAERETACRRLVAPAFDVPIGSWSPSERPELSANRRRHTLGVLIVNGLLTRAITLEGLTTGELLGTGDVLRPWDGEDAPAQVSLTVSWWVHAPTRMAVLDRRFLTAAARWPTVIEEIAQRAVRRSHALGLQLALGQVPRIEGRLLLLFWRLSERWGRVTPEGILVPLRLTHETLAALVSARRPSVTSALGRLAEAGLVERRDGGWLVHREATDHLAGYLAAREGGVRPR